MHLTDQVKAKLKSAYTLPAVISGGFTSELQPLDMCINNPFKYKVRKQWNLWMVDGPRETTKAGNLQCPGLAVVCN